MNLKEAIEKLKSFCQNCSAQKYTSHDEIKQKLNKLLIDNSFLMNITSENTKLCDEFQQLKIELEQQLENLKTTNQIMIKELNFEYTCIELINANDIKNLHGLIQIGEYFGTGPNSKDVCTPLDKIYDFFRTHPQKRNATNKPCLDYLCGILRQPRLPLPEHNFTMFFNKKEKVKAILKADASTDLMLWLTGANQEERDFALRCAASVDTFLECLWFLLLRASPTNQYSKVNLLAAGLPSGQIALHRAILSGKTLTVSFLLDEKFNPSNDLLKQLLVCDKDGLTPIDLIEKMIEKDDILNCSRIIKCMRTALNKYQDNYRFGLSERNIQSINDTLNRIQVKIDLTPKCYGL